MSPLDSSSDISPTRRSGLSLRKEQMTRTFLNSFPYEILLVSDLSKWAHEISLTLLFYICLVCCF